MSYTYGDASELRVLLAKDVTSQPDVLREILALNDAVAVTGEAIEGNVCYFHGTKPEEFRSAPPVIDGHHVLRRINLAVLARRRRSMLEIGLNAGHSALICLLANPTLQLFAVDIGVHAYTAQAAHHLKTRFGRRFQFFSGDSREVMPRLALDRPNLRFDLLHIDGGHTPTLAVADMSNALRMAQRGADFIVDDANVAFLSDALEHVCGLGYLAPLEDHSGLYETVLHQVLRVC